MNLSYESKCQIRDEWNELGFYYQIDKHNKHWIFHLNKEGLRKFCELINEFTDNYSNDQIGEHDHYGPYMYFKLVVMDKLIINEDCIGGKNEDLKLLAEFISDGLKEKGSGVYILNDGLLKDTEYKLKFVVKDENFKPGTMDDQIN